MFHVARERRDVDVIIYHYLDYLLTSDAFNELLEPMGRNAFGSGCAPTAFYLDPGAG